ncbi:MAG: Chromate resistance protein ChrB, partial [Anaerolineaceae bacterium]
MPTHRACRNMRYVETLRWLLLGHQLPARSSNARVKTWRRLQQIGAIPARNSVYVLPNTDQCREDFEWIRTEILALGGEATVFAADAISDGGTEDIEAMFRRARAQ